MEDFTKYFSEWFRSERIKSGHTLMSFSQLIGLSDAQVSRIENGLSTITLFSLVKIFHALYKAYPTTFIPTFPEKYIRIPKLYEKNRNKKFPALITVDFYRLLHHQSRPDLNCLDIRTVYQSLIESFCTVWAEKYGPNNKYQLLENLKDKLQNSQDFEQAPYPKNIMNSTLEENYLAVGVSCMRDLETYIRNSRIEKGLSFENLGNAVDLSHTTLRKFEQKMGPRVLFTDLLKLDDALDLDGNLIAIAWRVAEFYTGTRIPDNQIAAFTRPSKPWTPSRIEQFENIIYITRFFQHYFPEDRRWLASFRYNVWGFPYEVTIDAGNERDDPRRGHRKSSE